MKKTNGKGVAWYSPIQNTMLSCLLSVDKGSYSPVQALAIL